MLTKVEPGIAMVPSRPKRQPPLPGRLLFFLYQESLVYLRNSRLSAVFNPSPGPGAERAARGGEGPTANG